MIIWKLCMTIESYIEDYNKISPLDYFAYSCENFAWLCQILKNYVANISLCLISHYCAKIDPHAKTLHLLPTIFKILYLRKIYSRSQDTEEVEDHLFLFLFHSHSLISLLCPRPHTSSSTLILFIFYFRIFSWTLSAFWVLQVFYFSLLSFFEITRRI